MRNIMFGRQREVIPRYNGSHLCKVGAFSTDSEVPQFSVRANYSVSLSQCQQCLAIGRFFKKPAPLR